MPGTTSITCFVRSVMAAGAMLAAAGASCAPAAFISGSRILTLDAPAEAPPGSVLLAGSAGRRWCLRLDRREVIRLMDTGTPTSIPLPQEAEPRPEEIWSITAVGAGGEDREELWLVCGDRGLAWRLRGGAWSPVVHLGEATGAAVAVESGILVYCTPRSTEAAFAVFDAEQGRVVRRFGRRRIPAHPALDPVENLWILAVAHHQGTVRLTAAAVFAPEVRIYALPEGRLVRTAPLPERAIRKLVEARRAALHALRDRVGEDCSRCLRADLVVFADAAGSDGRRSWVHLGGQLQLIPIGNDDLRPAPLQILPEEAAAFRGLAAGSDRMAVATRRAVWEFRATDRLPIRFGSVVDGEGAPIGGATVRVADPERGVTLTAVSGPDGSFAVQGLFIPERGTVTVTAPGFQRTRARGRIDRLLARPIVLHRLPEICVRVIRRRDRQPVSEFTLRLLRPADRPGSAGAEQGPERRIEAPDGVGCLKAPWPLPLLAEVRADGLAVARERAVEVGREVLVELGPEARLSVHVVDGDGEEPVADARVDLAEPGAAHRSIRESVSPGSCRTLEDGTCELWQIEPGEYLLTVERQGFLPFHETVRLTAAGEAAEPPREVRLRRGATLEVTVTADGGAAPVAGASVGIAGIARPLSGHFSCRTDDRGRCSLEGVPPGTYRISASAVNLGSSSRRLVVPEEGPESTAVSLELSGDLRVEGTVEGLERYPGRRFSVLAGQTGLRRRTEVDASGGFAVEGLHSGRGWFYLVDRETGSGYAFEEHQLRGEDGVAEVTLTLPEPLTVWGRVTTADGPCDGCTVEAASRGAGALTVLVKTPTGADGDYELKLPTTGPYLVTARDPLSGGTARVQTTVSGDTALDLSIGGGTLSGVVVHSSDGAPVSGAAVRVSSRNGEAVGSTSTDGGGRFLVTGLPSELLEVVALAGGASASRTVDLRDTREAEVRLELEEAPAIRLRVLDPAGQPVRLLDAWVESTGAAPVAVSGLISDEDGTFRLPTASAGPCTVVIQAPGLARVALRGLTPGSDPVSVLEPLPAALTVRVDPARRPCELEILGGDGFPLALDLGPPGRRPIQGAGATLVALPPGPVTVRLITCDGQVLTAPALLAPDTPASVSFGTP